MSTYTSLNYHLVFSTKHRKPLIAVDWQPRLHGYFGAAIRDMGGVSLAIGGVEDHVHLLVGLKPIHCLADVLRDIKKSSSRWIHEELQLPGFAWQEGYAALSVSSEGLSAVSAYIAGQQRRHEKISSRDELLAILLEAGLEPDMRFFE